MEGTLREYRGLSPEEGLKIIMNLIDKCKSVEGIFTLLWHNTSLCRGWDSWVEEVYKKILKLC